MKTKPIRRSAIRRPRQPRRRGFAGFIDMYRRLPLWKKIFVIAWPTIILLVFIAIVTTITFASALGSKDALMNKNHTGVSLLDRNGKVFYEFNNAHTDTYVPLSGIAPVVQKAVVSSEDKDFYKHPGFSITGIANALYQNIIRTGGGGGGSTITQQLVKNALLSQERSIFRKYQEFILSIEVERRYSKDEILEMYLNSVYFGEGAFGIEDAAKVYFGKQAKDLDAAQAAMLVGVLPAPTAYSPISGDPAKAKARQRYVLDRMQKDGIITADQQAAAVAQELSYQPKAAETPPEAPHFALMVKEWLEKKYGEEKIARSGYKVTTTLNLDYQAKAEAAVKKQVSALARSKVSNGSAVAIDPRSGEVLALVGSADWNNDVFGKVNMATASRQPGSSFKPFVYGTGIENRQMTAATIFKDEPTNIGGYTPKNYDLRYRGDVTLRRALANSLNVPAVKAMQQVGIDNVISKAKAAGLTTLDKTAAEYGLPLALGSGQAKLIEMTSAYGAFGYEGKHSDVQLVMSIKNKTNQEIYKEKPTSNTVWSPGTAYIMSSILSDNSARSEVFGGSLTVSGSRPVAVKTGTTEDYRDAWAIGYTPSLAIGVWIGNNDNSQMNSVAGASGAAPIWVSLMRQLLTNTPIEKFTQPSTVVSHDVCRSDGALAQTSGDNTYNEFFLTGTLPTKTCNEPKQETKPQETPNQNQEDNTKAKDTTAPSTPSGVTATATSSTKVSLEWDASTDDTGVANYKIYRNGKQVATTSSTTYSDTGLTPLTTYSYTVVAVDAAGNASTQSTAATATTKPSSGDLPGSQ